MLKKVVLFVAGSIVVLALCGAASLEYVLLKSVPATTYTPLPMPTLAPIPKPTARAVLCFDPRLVGTWRRYGDQVSEQIFFFRDGTYGFVSGDGPSDQPNGSDGASTTGAARNNDPSDCFTGFTPFPGSRGRLLEVSIDHLHGGEAWAIVDKDELGLTLVDSVNSALRARFKRIIELPAIDWQAHAPDGGYLWDFAHTCAGQPRSIPMEGIVDDQNALRTGMHAPRQIIVADSDGTLWWSFGPKDALLKRDYCSPDKNTLIVAQPGPRGVVLPHRFDIFSTTGPYINGDSAIYDPRTYLSNRPAIHRQPFQWIDPRVIFGPEHPKNVDNGGYPCVDDNAWWCK